MKNVRLSSNAFTPKTLDYNQLCHKFHDPFCNRLSHDLPVVSVLAGTFNLKDLPPYMAPTYAAQASFLQPTSLQAVKYLLMDHTKLLTPAQRGYCSWQQVASAAPALLP